jgi:ABC-type transporter Mla subunit MlaD
MRDLVGMRKPALSSPLRDAAEALDQALERYATLADDLRHEPATSEKSLRRSARILQALGETEQLLGQNLGRLVEAIDARRRRQEATVSDVQRLAESLRGRSELFGELLKRCDALAKHAADANAILQEGAASDTDADTSVIVFEQTAAGPEALAGDARRIGVSRPRRQLRDIARQTDGLEAQLMSAHKKILLMCGALPAGGASSTERGYQRGRLPALEDVVADLGDVPGRPRPQRQHDRTADGDAHREDVGHVLAVGIGRRRRSAEPRPETPARAARPAEAQSGQDLVEPSHRRGSDAAAGDAVSRMCHPTTLSEVAIRA